MDNLAVAMLWNYKDQEAVAEYVEYAEKLLSRDVNFPFSRTINLPVFTYHSNEGTAIQKIPEIELDCNSVVLYIFIGKNSVASNKWRDYISANVSIWEQKNYHIVPIALDSYAYNICGNFKDRNFIRLYEFENYKKQRLFLNMAHEIYRLSLSEAEDDKLPLKVFISHTKVDPEGMMFAEKLKKFLERTVIKNFFDACDIGNGNITSEAIEKHIKESSVVVVNSDHYASRFWCQKEVRLAKDAELPMIEVDLLQSGADRKFPYASNIPVVRANLVNNEVSEEILYKVVESVLLETVRVCYAKKNLPKKYPSFGAKYMCRPPEVIDISGLLANKGSAALGWNEIIYPDPPVYDIEADVFRKSGIKVKTPTQIEKGTLESIKVGISISEPDEDLYILGQNARHLKELSSVLCNYLLTADASLIFGGDLRDDGFTENLMEEARRVQEKTKVLYGVVKNYLAWPLYLQDKERLTTWQAKYAGLLDLKKVSIADEVVNLLDNKDEFVPPITIEQRYAWSSSLTKMRQEMIADCDVRICAGGRRSGYKGCMPGVLEEILIAMEQNKIIYLLGGFGGVVADICKLLCSDNNQSCNVCDALDYNWQIANNPGYSELLRRYEDCGSGIDYKDIYSRLSKLSENGLNNGLSYEDNKKLYQTVFVDEAIELILKGLKNLKKEGLV